MTNRFPYFIALASSFGLISLSANAADIATNTARMQAMDKITGRVSEIDVPVGGIANFGTFSVLVRKCVTKSPEEPPENIAFVDVVDNYQSNDPVNIFKGWMFSSTPALNAVEHPIYDIWLLKCYNRPQDKSQLLSEDQLSLRDTIPMVRHESVLPKADSLPSLDFDNSDTDDNLNTDTSSVATQDSADSQTTNTSNAVDDNVITIDLTSSPSTLEENIIEEDFVSEGEEPENLLDLQTVPNNEKEETSTYQ